MMRAVLSFPFLSFSCAFFLLIIYLFNYLFIYLFIYLLQEGTVGMAEKVPRDLEDLLDLKVYSKNPHKKTRVLGVQGDFVLIFRVFSAKSA